MRDKKSVASGVLACSHKVMGATIPSWRDKVSKSLTNPMKLMRRIRVIVKIEGIEVNLPKPSHILTSDSAQQWIHQLSQPL